MATLRDLKTRIGSVASSEKITGAMKMISSAKVHKSEADLRELMPYKKQLQSIMTHILGAGVEFDSALIQSREVKKICVVVYGSDDGLCGAYNMNIFKGLLAEINRLHQNYGEHVSITVVPVGKKIERPVAKIDGQNLTMSHQDGVDSKMSGERVDAFTNDLRVKFLKEEFDLIEVIYMQFYSMSRQRLTIEQLFPITEESLSLPAERENGNGRLSDKEMRQDNKLYIFEPDANTIFNTVLPMFVLSTMQEITISNRASEQAARVMAMQSANDNAKKLLDSLHLEYNKLRQQSITTELLDIVGGQTQR